MSLHRPSKGFTLIEVMVVIVIASLMVAILVFGFDQTLKRRKGAAAEEVFQWLQAAADTAVFQSTVVGVTQKQNQLMLLAFYQDDWYKLADQEPLSLSEEISISWSESLTGVNGLHDEDDLSPYIVILPSGDILPEGEIRVLDKKDSASQNIDSYQQDQALALFHWEDNTGFDLHWQSPQ